MSTTTKPRKDKEKKEKREKKTKKLKAEIALADDSDTAMADAATSPEVKKKSKRKTTDESTKDNHMKESKDEPEAENSAKEEKRSKPKKRKSISNGNDTESPKKRKLSPTLEIDINAPEPPSKKAIRKLKKAGLDPTDPAVLKPTKHTTKPANPDASFPEHASQSRSKYGIWIGNLSFQTTKPRLEEFLVVSPSTISRTDITRINLPLNTSTGRNRGFAYIDFDNAEALEYALSLSESLLDSRRVLIKDSKDFSNRNVTTSEPVAAATSNITKNPPSKILYAGNLDFDITAEMLKEHFGFAGKIVKVRLATFEDSGKCKGFGFIDFEDVESVKRAMLGLTKEEEAVYQELEGKKEVEMHKRRRKRAILGGRPIKMEFGEDSSVRYKKRFGKVPREEGEEGEGGDGRRGRPERRSDGPPQKWVRKDNRIADAGAAYSADPRRTGAITEAKGKKMSFDD